ncbi:metallophosphoesterase family protein [Granulosicoccus sp. 3-233]|uniref:metallophosphoesterase family protein n=1 Tax=Granulosicoccus sp. 3-233 TaxID=3417969 RepID=UPI003D35871B
MSSANERLSLTAHRLCAAPVLLHGAAVVIRVGVISDTHGLLRPEALDALQGVEHIIHAGDIGKGDIIEALSAIAPVTAVHGNIDKGEIRSLYPHDAVLPIAGHHVYVLHILDELKIDPAAAGFQVVVYGHSHKPAMERKADVLYLNPGSAGPRRFSLPVTCAVLCISDAGVDAEILHLAV